MSTKVTWFYGNPERDGKENDYHLYFDYADFGVHLEINGKEVKLPPKLQKELELLHDIFESATYLAGALYAIAEYRGAIDFYRHRIEEIGKGALGRYKTPDDSIDSDKKEEVEDLDKIIEEIRSIMKDYEDIPESMNYIEFGRIKTTVILLPAEKGTGFQIIVVDNEKKEAKSVRSTAEAISSLLKKGATEKEIALLASFINDYAMDLMKTKKETSSGSG